MPDVIFSVSILEQYPVVRASYVGEVEV